MQRIGSLNDGLKAWQDHLQGILNLDKNREGEIQGVKDTLVKVKATLDEAQNDKYRTKDASLKEVEKMRDNCKVRESDPCN